ncbi:ZIP family metal transporter [Fictibacillus macauensis]|nr:ZIP family metal transporter [Fictibacillus macauensis]
MMIFSSIVFSSLCTTIGALPVFFIKNVTHKGKDILLAYTAGIMVAASAYGLIPSAIKLSNVFVLIVGVLVGTFVLTLLESTLPHVDLQNNLSLETKSSFFLFFIAMSLHNLPEGLSVGISYAGGATDLAPVVAFAIGLQNIPEGFLIALFLMTQNVSPFKATMLASLTACVELIAALVGVLFGQSFAFIIPYGLAFAAGSMLFIVYKELIPESHGDGNERVSTLSFILGFLMMVSFTHFLR